MYKRVPDDLRFMVGKGQEKCSLGTRDPAEAKVRLLQAMAEVDARWRNLRAGPKKLTEMEAQNIALTPSHPKSSQVAVRIVASLRRQHGRSLRADRLVYTEPTLHPLINTAALPRPDADAPTADHTLSQREQIPISKVFPQLRERERCLKRLPKSAEPLL